MVVWVVVAIDVVNVGCFVVVAVDLLRTKQFLEIFARLVAVVAGWVEVIIIVDKVVVVIDKVVVAVVADVVVVGKVVVIFYLGYFLLKISEILSIVWSVGFIFIKI